MNIIVKRLKDTVKVSIMYDRNSEKYAFVNLTKNHICECRFNNITEALADLEEHKRKGLVIEWFYESPYITL